MSCRDAAAGEKLPATREEFENAGFAAARVFAGVAGAEAAAVVVNQRTRWS